MNNDSKLMKHHADNNIWPVELLEKYHPRKGFSASSADFPAPLHFLITVSNADVQGIVSFAGQSLLSLPQELVRWVLQDTRYDDGWITQTKELYLQEAFTKVVVRAFAQAREEKEVLQVPRPKTYHSESFGESYSEPCASALMLGRTVCYLADRIDLLEEQIQQLQNASYLLAMLSVMAGKNHINDVVQGLITSGMWDLKPSPYKKEASTSKQ